MRRSWPGLTCLLSLLLVLQWASATLPHARSLVALGSATAVELCSAHGARTILVGEDGQPLDRQQAPDCCGLCLLPVVAPPPISAAPPLPVAFALAVVPPTRPGLPPLPPHAPPQLPRAPPPV